MNPDQLLAHAKRLVSTLSVRQQLSLVAAFAAVVAIVAGSAYWLNTTSYALLYSDLDAESAGTVTAKLKNDKVAYVLEDGGRTIRVDATKLDELRLAFAGQSLPSSGRIGFEIFDRTAFGTTVFLEQVNYRRALEGELARTISTIGEVASARVHIALAKESLFVADTQPAKASVVLKLRNRTPPSAATVAAIAGLVSSSVESLRPEAVVIMDTFGRPLSKPAGDRDEVSGAELDKQDHIERDLTSKVVALLEPVVGAGRVRVNVTARLDQSSEDQTEERWDPTTVVRSKQMQSDSANGANVAQGIAGARANTPAPANGAAPAAASPTPVVTTPSTSRTAETTTYEVSKLTRHQLRPGGRIARLSVAVVLDDERAATTGPNGETKATSKPRSRDEMQRLQRLVASSVGLDADRGDEVTVENIAFGDLVDDAPVALKWWQKFLPTNTNVATIVAPVARGLVVLVLGLLALLFVVRPVVRYAMEPLPVALPSAQFAGQSGAQTVADLESQIEAELDAARPQSVRLPVLTRRLARTASEKPEHMARVVRTWLAEEEQ